MARIVPDKAADASVAARIAMFSALPAGARTGVTHDNGAEFARHGRQRGQLGMAAYFAPTRTARTSAGATRTATA